MKLTSFFRKQAPPAPLVEHDDAALLRVLEHRFDTGIEIKTGVSLNEGEFIETLRLQQDAARRVI